jgi:hypothetical protein
MKNLLAKSLLFALLLVSCEQQDIEVKKENLPKIAFTSLGKEIKLNQAINQIGLSKKTNSSGRLMSGLAEYKPDSILKVLQSDSTNYSYTIAIDKTSKSGSFKNLVFSRVSNGFYAFVLEYASTVSVIDFDSFTGTVKRFDLEGTLLQEVSLSKARLDNPNGRSMACFADVDTECVSGGGISTATGMPLPCLQWVTTITLTCDGGSSGGATGGWSNPGTYVQDPYIGGGLGGGSSSSGGSSSGGTNPPSNGDPSFEGSDPIGVLPPKPPVPAIFEIKADTSLTKNQKANCIFNKLGGNSTFQNLVKDFDNNSSTLNLTFVLGSTSPYNGLTRSVPPYRDVTIILDKAKVEARRTVEVARTFLHESIHAKIFADLSKVGGYENLNKDNFPELFDAYVFHKTNGQKDVMDRTHHEYMARQYIDIIAAGLQQFDTPAI